MARLLGKLDIETINDLLFFLPRRYDDYTQLTYVSRLQPDTVATVIGSVNSATVRAGKNGRKDFMCPRRRFGIHARRLFGMHFLARRIKPGHQLVVRGPITLFGHQLEMVNPEWEHLEGSNLHTTGIVPIYPLTEGLGARSLRRLMKTVILDWSERLPDYIPEAVLDRAELADLGWTVKNLHFPDGWDHLHHAKSA
jgi:ATP-dependent DNA helicase RecG